MEKFPARQEKIKESFDWKDIKEVETAKGSTYRYLEDGTTQRFKKAENKEYDPQAALVYVPGYKWVKEHAPPQILEKLGENELIYNDILLEYVQNPRKEGKKVYIIDKVGKKIETNAEIQSAEGQIYLAFLTGDTVDFSIPAYHKPEMGFMTFDTRTYTDEETGEYMRERHLGNAVVRIGLREEGE